MDPFLLLALAAAVAAIILAVSYLQRRSPVKQDVPPNPDPAPAPMEAAAVVGGMRRVRGGRHRLAAQRARAAAEAAEREEGLDQVWEGEEGEWDEREEEEEEEAGFKMPGKVGTKKMKKIQEKAEKKAQREQELVVREERKRREAVQEKERKREAERERLLGEKEAAEEAKRREEEERREAEEYARIKASFVVEEEGEDAKEEEGASQLRDFIDYIKRNKVVFLEDLAAEFGLRAQDAIAQVQTLQETGDLTGVIDDRGKFIYISQEELAAVARFVKQRGRVSIAELAAASSSLINLLPDPVPVQ